MVTEVNDKNFDNEVLKSTLPVLVDFWAAWCGPCRMVSPIVDKMAVQYAGKVKVCKLNVDENQTTASKYRVMSIPTLMFIKNGKAVETVIGAVPESTLKSKIEGVLAKKE